MASKYDKVGYYQELEIQQPDDLETRGESQLISSKNKNKSFICSLKMMCILLLAISLIFILLSFLQTDSISPIDDKEENSQWINVKEQIEHKTEDNANYELFTIPKNNLKVLLITSKNLKLSSASLDVKAGSQNNPKDLQGLAHFLEHMLFMGSQKYPEVDAFDNLVSQSGGSFNAYTSGGNTNYFFQATNNNFLDIIDIWSRFFIDPLLKEDLISKEVKAVDSEYMNTLTREGFRLFNLYIALSDEEHPFKIFACGNTEVLTKNNTEITQAYQALHSFLKKFYYSENMSLVIKSDETLRSNLKNKIFESFQLIPTKEENYQKLTDKEEKLIFNPKKPTKQFPITKPIHTVLFEMNQMKKLVISFLLDDSKNDGYSSIEFARDLFEYGFEGTNFCYLLEDRRLTTECKITVDEEDGTLNRFVIFKIQLQFMKNEDCIEEIVKSYFYFIDKVANYPNKQQVYQKFKEIKKGLFNILDNTYFDTPMQEVAEYAKQLNRDKLKDIQTSELLYKSYNEEHFSEIMSVLTDPSRIIIIHKTSNSTFTKDKTILRDQTNDLNYTKTEISQDQYANFKQYQNLNFANASPVSEFFQFTDTILNVTSSNDEDNEPKLILMNEKGRVYSQRDVLTFKKPLHAIYLKFESNILSENVNARVANLLLLKNLQKEINRRSFLLKLYGLKIEVDLVSLNGGLTIQIQCLDSQVDQTISMVKDCIENIISSLFKDQQTFEDYRQQVIDSINNFKNQMIYLQFSDILNSFIHEHSYSYGDILQLVQNVKFDDMKQYVEKFLDTYFLTFYAFGDVNNIQIKSSFNKLITLSKRTEEYVYTSKYVLTKNKPVTIQLVFDSGDKSNSLCSVFYPIGKVDIQELTILNLIEKPLKTQAFNYLRTTKQLGYVATSKVINRNDFYGLIVLVQGTNHNPDVYDQHIEEFLQKFEEFLINLTSDEIKSMQESLIQSLNIETFAKFTDKSNYFWPYINEKSYEYSTNQEIIKILEKQQFSSKDLLDFFFKYFKDSNSRLSIQLFSPSKMKQSELPIQPKSSSGYSGNLGTIVTSREEFNKISFEYYNFEDKQNKK